MDTALRGSAATKDAPPGNNNPTAIPVRAARLESSGDPLRIEPPLAPVGNSDTLTGYGLGTEIDNHATVFRFNLAPQSKDFQTDVGVRTSAFFLSKNITGTSKRRTQSEQDTLATLCREHTVLCFPGQSISTFSKGRVHYYYELGLPALNRVFRSHLGDEYDPFTQTNHPRNGIKLIAALLDVGIAPRL